MGFAIVFNIGDIYYQQQLLEKEVIRDYTKRSPSYIWISLHLLLSLTILFFAAGVKLVYDEESEHSSNKEQWLMCLCAGASLFVIFTLRMRYKGICYTEYDPTGKTTSFRGLSYLFR